jgi:hypothetical protein
MIFHGKRCLADSDNPAHFCLLCFNSKRNRWASIGCGFPEFHTQSDLLDTTFPQKGILINRHYG